MTMPGFPFLFSKSQHSIIFEPNVMPTVPVVPANDVTVRIGSDVTSRLDVDMNIVKSEPVESDDEVCAVDWSGRFNIQVSNQRAKKDENRSLHKNGLSIAKLKNVNGIGNTAVQTVTRLGSGAPCTKTIDTHGNRPLGRVEIFKARENVVVNKNITNGYIDSGAPHKRQRNSNIVETYKDRTNTKSNKEAVIHNAKSGEFERGSDECAIVSVKAAPPKRGRGHNNGASPKCDEFEIPPKKIKKEHEVAATDMTEQLVLFPQNRSYSDQSAANSSVSGTDSSRSNKRDLTSFDPYGAGSSAHNKTRNARRIQQFGANTSTSVRTDHLNLIEQATTDPESDISQSAIAFNARVKEEPIPAISCDHCEFTCSSQVSLIQLHLECG
jgi:hypothetical protein